jgi:hypothetical protein
MNFCAVSSNLSFFELKSGLPLKKSDKYQWVMSARVIEYARHVKIYGFADPIHHSQ